jgi:F-type H+-transporting ATPase subunit epsilon
MATESLKLEIVTPTGMAFSRDVTEVGAPTLDGEVGVLPGHVPFLAALRTGIVSARPTGSGAGEEPQRFAIAHGVLEVAHEKALVLTEKFAQKEDVDVVKVRARLKDVDDELLGWTGELTDPKRVALIEEEQWLATQLELIGDPPQPTMRELTRFQAKDVDETVVIPEDTPTPPHGNMDGD